MTTTHLFEESGLPRQFALTPRLTVYRLELYGYAECINLGSLLRGPCASLDARKNAVLDDLLSNGLMPDGSLRSRRLMRDWDNVPMRRWGQTRAFRARAAYAITTSGAS